MYEILPIAKSNFVIQASGESTNLFLCIHRPCKIEDSSANFMENTVLAGNFTRYVTCMGMCTAIHGKC